MKTRDLTQGNPAKLIMGVALPLMLGNVFQQLYTVVDALIVGGFVGVSALAAVGAGDWFYWMLLGMIQGLAQGFAIPMAHFFGAKDNSSLKRSVGNAALLSIVIILAVTALSLLFITPVLDLLGTPDEIQPTTESYLSVIFAGFPVVMAYNLFAGILRSLGDAKTPLLAMLLSAVVNISLDLLFVCGFSMGVVGAAVATVIAQCCSCIFCFVRLFSIEFVRPSRGDFRFDPKMCLRLLKLGVPISLQNGIIGAGGMFVQNAVNKLGVSFLAGYTASNKLYGVLEIAAISYGYAVCAYSGQNLGAGNIERIKKGVRQAILIGLATAAVISCVMFIFGDGILSGFISGEVEETAEAMKFAGEYLNTMCICLWILYVLNIYRSALQGIGNAVFPMASGIIELFMRVGAVLILPGIIGYRGVFLSEVLAWTGAAVILTVSYFVIVRKLKHNAPTVSAEIKNPTEV